MIWGKRRFEDAEYGPYMDKLEKVMLADARRADQYALVSVEIDDADWYFVGVPDDVVMRLFDGFTPVAKGDLPQVIDVLHVDAGAVARHFKFRRDSF